MGLGMDAKVGAGLAVVVGEKFVETLPKVDVLVAARDEENVIERLVSRLLSIEYPEEKISLWIN